MAHNAEGTFSDDGSDPALVAFLPGDMRSSQLRLRLLGGFSLLVDGYAVELTPVTARLVALLALAGRSSRSRVAGTLWPESSQVRASACLRSGVWRANSAATGLIASTRSSLELGGEVEVDVHRYTAWAAGLMESDRRPDGVGTPRYGGDLLPDWDDEWILADRERLRQLRLHVLEEQAERLTRARSYGLALDAALAALVCDPLRESAHRAIMRIHLAEGNTSEARRAYRTCQRVLRRDLGVEPSESTTRMLTAGRGR